MKSIIPRLLVFAAIALFLSHCGAPIKITSAEASQLDPDFAGYKGVLLVMRNNDNKSGYNTIDRTISKSFEKSYKGEFKLITWAELAQYPDLEKYKYAVKHNFFSRRVGGNPPAFEQSSQYILINRKTGKEFTTKTYPGYSALEQFPAVFESLRSSK